MPKRFCIFFLMFATFVLPVSISGHETIMVDSVSHGPIDRARAALKKASDWCWIHDFLYGLDASVSLSTMGVGLEIASPVTKWTKVRAGVDWLPRIRVPMHFGLRTYSYGIPTGSFNQVSQMFYNLTGIEIDDRVKMISKGSMVNFKFLVDIFPFQNNTHWHVTAGFYAGTSEIGRSINDLEEKPTLVGLNVYNRAYEYFTNLESIFNVPLGGGGYMDPDLVEKIQEKFRKYGRIGVHIGDFKDGTPYIMEPAPDGTISARMLVNHFKPYIGVGYGTHLDRKHNWFVGVDLGVLFWGGAPSVINHDYNSGKDINFTKDLVNIRGKVGDYMKVIHSFPVYPVLVVKFSYNIL